MIPVEIDYYCQQDRCLNYAALALAVYAPREIGIDYAMARISSRHRRYTMADEARAVETVEMVRLVEQGYSYRTIAKMLGQKPATVWQRVKRWRVRHAG